MPTRRGRAPGPARIRPCRLPRPTARRARPEHHRPKRRCRDATGLSEQSNIAGHVCDHRPSESKGVPRRVKNIARGLRRLAVGRKHPHDHATGTGMRVVRMRVVAALTRLVQPLAATVTARALGNLAARGDEAVLADVEVAWRAPVPALCRPTAHVAHQNPAAEPPSHHRPRIALEAEVAHTDWRVPAWRRKCMVGVGCRQSGVTRMAAIRGLLAASRGRLSQQWQSRNTNGPCST